MAQAPAFIEAQPLEFRDFSGGLTENYLQGDTKRFVRADNFLITVDKKLEHRPGTKLYDPTAYSLPGNSGRVSGLFTGVSETLLFAHANRDLYTQSPAPSYGTAWAAIRGPTNNEAISAGNSYNLLTRGEFQRQIYYTTDAPSQPGKIFRDQTNAWKAVTAGLPKPSLTPTFPTNQSLIDRCILLANALRVSMLGHFRDAAASYTLDTTTQHSQVDNWSRSYLESFAWTGFEVDFPGPVPAPTPAPAATDEASLYTLCEALSLAYEHHRNDIGGADPVNSVGVRLYHQPFVIYPAAASTAASPSGTIPSSVGIHAKLGTSGEVASAAKAATFLNDLAQKWYWHQLAPFAHSETNVYATMSRYLIAVAKVPTVYLTGTQLQVEANTADFTAFAYFLKYVWNQHASYGGGYVDYSMHAQPDPYGPITIPDPFDFDSAALTIFWARWAYGKNHVYDSNTPVFLWVDVTTTATSSDLTGVIKTTLMTNYEIPVNEWIQYDFNSTFGLFTGAAANSNVAQIATSGSAIANIAPKTATSSSTFTLVSTASWFHGNFTSGNPAETAAHAATAAEFLSSPGSVGTDLATWIDLGEEFIVAIAAHSANANSHLETRSVSSELTELGIAPTNGNPFFVPTVASYGYALFYKYVYTVEPNGIFYQNSGAPIFSTAIQTTPSYPVGTVIPSANDTYLPEATILQSNTAITLTGIPSLLNTSITNYDTVISVVPQPTEPSQSGYYSNLTIELYRTIDGGTTFYYLDSLQNLPAGASQDYLDTTNESFPLVGETALNLRQVIYTSGGVVANDQPPTCKYILSLNGFMYYGAIIDTGQYFPQRIRQSIQGQPDSAPANFFDDLEDELTGLSSSKSVLIAGCKNSLYRVTGSFTSTGQGAMAHENIGDSIGVLNAQSMVRTEIGVFFAGSDGFYYTDGYQLIKISIDLNQTYLALTSSESQKARIYGAYDKLTRRVWWAMKSSETSPDNDVFYTFYLDYGVKPSGTFTKARTNQSWQPSSATFFKGALIIGDSRGYLFKSDPLTKTDPLVNTAVSPTTWRTVYMPWNFASCALDFGTTFKRKYITKIHAIGQNVGNAAIQIVTVNDNNDTSQGPGTLDLPALQYVGNPMWGDPLVVWGDETYDWKYDGKMDAWRRFPARSMRSDFRQICYEPGDFVVYKSDNWPEFSYANVNSTTKTATITTPSGYTSILWPLDVVDLYISFSEDEYAERYLITALDATKKIITYSDAGNATVTSTTQKWQISGIKKEQRVRITAFDVHFGYLGDENAAYPGGSAVGGEGGNASS